MRASRSRLGRVRVRPLDHGRRAARRDVAEAAPHLPGGEVADGVVRLAGQVERAFEGELEPGRDEERLPARLLAQEGRQPGEEAVHRGRLPVAGDQRVQRVVERACAVEDGHGLGDARELRRGSLEAEAPGELRGERLRVGADHDRDLAGKKRGRDLLEMLHLGHRAAADRERLLAEDRGVHSAQERARLEPELLDEELAAFAVDLERLRLPARAVEGEHQLRPQPLAQRIGADEPLELGDEVGVLPDRQLRLGALLEEGEAELVEPRDLLLRERLVAEVGQRLAPPQGERLVEERRPAHGLARPRLVDEAPHAGQVELLGPEPNDVARRARLDRIRAERLPQLRDEVLERRHRGRRRLTGPERFDEPVDRDDPPGLEQQQRQERPLLRAAERDRLAAIASLQRTEDGVFDQVRGGCSTAGGAPPSAR